MLTWFTWESWLKINIFEFEFCSVFSQQPTDVVIPDVGATDSPQYYADSNPMYDVDGSDIPDDLFLR